MINLIIAFVIGIILSRICQWLMMKAGLVIGYLVVLAKHRQNSVLENGAIALSVILRSYIALSFSTLVIDYLRSAVASQGLAIAIVVWPAAFLLANTPAWNSLRAFRRQFHRVANDMESGAGGLLEQARKRILYEEMGVHFYRIHFYVFVISVIGFPLLAVFPLLRADGWGWVQALLALANR